VTHRIAEIAMTLGDRQGYSPAARLFRWEFSYSCGAVDKMSPDIARRAVPLR